MNRIFLYSSFLLGFLFLTGCSFPFYTTKISGQIKNEAVGTLSGIVIVVYYEKSFVEMKDTSIRHQRTKIITMNNQKQYVFSPDMATASARFYIIWPGYYMAQNFFYQNLGQSDVVFDDELQAIENWQSYYYFVIKPLLSGFISNPEYNLAGQDKSYILNWQEKIEASFK